MCSASVHGTRRNSHVPGRIVLERLVLRLRHGGEVDQALLEGLRHVVHHVKGGNAEHLHARRLTRALRGRRIDRLDGAMQDLEAVLDTGPRRLQREILDLQHGLLVARLRYH